MTARPTSPSIPTRLAIFGASGGLGHELVLQALNHGFTVRALVPPERAVGQPDGAVERVEGSLLDPDAVGRTVEGSDGVCCVYGSRPPYAEISCAEATRNVVTATRRAEGVRRLVCVTDARVGAYPGNRSLALSLAARSWRKKYPQQAADRERQEEIVRESGLDWTLVKPPRLSPGHRSHRVRAGPDVTVGLLSAVSRADIAAFLLAELVERNWVGEAVFLRA